LKTGRLKNLKKTNLGEKMKLFLNQTQPIKNSKKYNPIKNSKKYNPIKNSKKYNPIKNSTKRT
jgi:hypothetical protein